MFSKEEASKLRQLFWTSFGKSFPRKWILYKTGIKGFSFKFVAERKYALVAMDIESGDVHKNKRLYDQLLSLKAVLESDYIADVIFDEQYTLASGKIIHRIYASYPQKFSIYNKDTWAGCYKYFNHTMPLFESFFNDFEDYIRN